MARKSACHRYALCLIPLLLLALAIPPHSGSAAYRRGWAELVQSLSEPGGYFDSDNFVSNESSYLTVVPRIKQLDVGGGVYIGVGPDQNFSYLAAIRPEQAIIIDIRRQNLLQHVLLKALMERASSRLEYLALLFSKPLPPVADLGKDLTLEQLLDWIDRSESDQALYEKNLQWVRSCILRKFRLALTDRDYRVIDYIYKNFQAYNLDIRYKSYGREFQWRYPTLRSLTLERDLNGAHANYLVSESDFQWLKKFQEEDRLIPVVGDLGGKTAMKKIARYLKEHRWQVGAFYVSNVEFYLMRNGAFETYINNVREFPTTDRSIFIRSYFGYGVPHPEQVDGYWMSSLLQGIRSFLRQHDRSPYYSHRDLATRDYISIRPER
ncbi:MAG: hypothetical protein HYX74_10125 [Acidobacteria bacterium]|nr:hypothetical protein [Acidobacteriota bacterium]